MTHYTNASLAWQPANNPNPATELQPASGLQVNFDNGESPHRVCLEQTIYARFKASYDADLQVFLPYLLSVSRGGQIRAVLGVRPAGSEHLFLEQYLDSPVQQRVSAAFRQPVDRSEIVEVGNLAANAPGATHALFALLACALHAAGYRWLVCTVTDQVNDMLTRLSFPTETLGVADPARLRSGADHWGAYYDCHPRVVAGDIRLARQVVVQSSLLSAPIQSMAGAIVEIGRQLRRSKET